MQNDSSTADIRSHGQAMISSEASDIFVDMHFEPGA
jgi:hypothetical protein